MTLEVENDTVKEEEPKDTHSILATLVDMVKSLTARISRPSDPVGSSGMVFFKDKEGVYHWIARYSNNFRDDDNPPEIISADSHRKFAALVKEGVVKPPDLWFWHESDWKWGVGEWVSYDSDTGFALAGGTVDPQFNELAEVFSKQQGNYAVSHGMPAWSISRDNQDGSVITEHLTVEVSPLPRWAAANKLTSFHTFTEDTMAFTKEEKARLAEQHGVSVSLLEQIEAHNAVDAQQAKEANIESKEADAPVEAQEPAPAQVEQELGSEVKALLKALTESVVALRQTQADMAQEIKALKQTDEVKVAKQTKDSSLASLADMLASSVVGSDAARVDGRSTIAKSGPVETAPTQAGNSPFPWLNQMIQGGGSNG